MARCVAASCVALLLACTRAEQSHSAGAGVAAGGARSDAAGQARSASPEASAGELRPPSASLKSELGFECRELGADEPVADEPPGRGVPRLKAASAAGLPKANIAYAFDQKLWLVSSDGQRRTLLGPGSRPEWHPRGTSLFFVSSRAGHLPRLFEVSSDCSSLRVLTGPLIAAAPESSETPFDADTIRYAVSPDGELVAFTRPAESGDALYVVERATGNERKLASDVDARDVDVGDVAWLPDSRSLAFVTSDALSASVMTLELATGQVRKLAGVQRGLLAPLPDGRLLLQSAFDADNTIEARQARLYQLDLVRGAAQPLAGSELGPGEYDELRVSPDGSKLAASWSLWTGNGPAAVRDHGLALFRTPGRAPAAAGSAELRFPGTPFSRDGAIVFTRPKVPNLSRSASGERYTARAPSWAPDSRHLVFELAYCGGWLGECRSQIVAVDTATAGAPLVFLANGSVPTWASR